MKFKGELTDPLQWQESDKHSNYIILPEYKCITKILRIFSFADQSKATLHALITSKSTSKTVLLRDCWGDSRYRSVWISPLWITLQCFSQHNIESIWIWLKGLIWHKVLLYSRKQIEGYVYKLSGALATMLSYWYTEETISAEQCAWLRSMARNGRVSAEYPSVGVRSYPFRAWSPTWLHLYRCVMRDLLCKQQ